MSDSLSDGLSELKISDDVPKPPIDTPGHWVSREEFKGNKSFGFFACKRCKNEWMSAHAFAKFQQGCVPCKKYNLPKWMWVNEDKDRALDATPFNKPEKPHLSRLCKACAAGVCKVGRQ